jgi:nucleoside-diphosphate-sugar epimerase
MNRILITGAAGAIGKLLRAACRGKYQLRLSDNALQLLTWISHRDMTQLIERCIDHPDYHFAVIYGVSKNLRSRWNNTNVKFLGDKP